MGKIKQKITTFNEALLTLDSAITLYREYEALVTKQPAENNEIIFWGLRDSLIQRFEYCTDLLWKVLKLYLEEVGKVTLASYTPATIIREAVRTKVLTDDEGRNSLAMIKSRNQTSYIYHIEIAEDIAQKIPNYYQLMHSTITRLSR